VHAGVPKKKVSISTFIKQNLNSRNTITLNMVDFSISDQLDAEGKIIDKYITITTYNTTSKQQTYSTGELKIKEMELEGKKAAIDKELDEINLILAEVNK
jgi:hypothetical protein